MVFCGAARRNLSNEESGYTRPRPLGGGNPALPPEALRAAHVLERLEWRLLPAKRQPGER